MFDKKVPLWYAILIWAMKLNSLKLGEKNWKRFVKISEVSNIPIEFTLAFLNSKDSYIRSGEKIFHRKFRNDHMAMYAITYSHAIASVKTYFLSQNILSENREKLNTAKEKYSVIMNLLSRYANILGCDVDSLPDKLHNMGIINDSEKLTLTEQTFIEKEISDLDNKINNQFITLVHTKKLAQLICGNVVQLEMLFSRPPISKAVVWISWQIKHIFGNYPSTKDLNNIRKWIEDYFSQESNRAFKL
jgi:hypothetical protein